MTVLPPRTAPLPPRTAPANRLLGALLLLPATLALLWSYVLPSLSTVVESFQRGSLLGQRRPAPPIADEGAGFENYERALNGNFFGGLGTVVLMALVPLLAALVVAPLLALAADRAGRVARVVTRVLLALPIALYAPTAVVIGWYTGRLRDGSWEFGARSTSVWVFAWLSAGLVVAIAATAFLAVLRDRSPGRRPGPALLVVGAVLGLGILATVLQTITVPLLLPTRSPPPVSAAVLRSLAVADFGPGAAASVVLLVMLGVLGLGTVALLLATRTRIEVAPAEPVRPAHPAAVVAVAVGGVALLAILGYALFPWLRHTTSLGGDLPRGFSTGRIILNTWLPPLVSAVVGVGLAALGGYAIGALRPLGRWSELLLLPFAPWLFVGTGPLAIAGYQRTRDFSQIDTFLGLIPPTWLSIPALVLFTLFFRARRSTVVSALPLAAFTLLLVWLLSAQEVLWPYLVAQSPTNRPAPLTAVTLSQGLAAFGGTEAALALVLPLPLLLLFAAAFVALQVGYLDRLTVRIGRERSAFAPPPGAAPPVPGMVPPPGTAPPPPRPVPPRPAPPFAPPNG
ncbi:sugar ABC transporter permease [Phytohabitans kaempferiae]|uniref:Sugar ABC transporter permease n=1 Tax=Phytohabitans kaempferiae TaxID=1620943 RepID=A0ABV6MHA1_9ACTN